MYSKQMISDRHQLEKQILTCGQMFDYFCDESSEFVLDCADIVYSYSLNSAKKVKINFDVEQMKLNPEEPFKQQLFWMLKPLEWTSKKEDCVVGELAGQLIRSQAEYMLVIRDIQKCYSAFCQELFMNHSGANEYSKVFDLSPEIRPCINSAKNHVIYVCDTSFDLLRTLAQGYGGVKQLERTTVGISDPLEKIISNACAIDDDARVYFADSRSKIIPPSEFAKYASRKIFQQKINEDSKLVTQEFKNELKEIRKRLLKNAKACTGIDFSKSQRLSSQKPKSASDVLSYISQFKRLVSLSFLKGN